MDTKQIAIYGGGFLASFLVLLAAMYVIYPYLHPEQAQQVEMQVSSNPAGHQFDPNLESPESIDPNYSSREPVGGNSASSEAVDAMNRQISDMQNTIDTMSSSREQYETTIDSLESVIADLKAEQERQEAAGETSGTAGDPAATPDGGQQANQQAGMQFENATGAGQPQVTEADTQQADLAEISKSLLRMDEEALAPILNLLDDDQLVSLYRTSTNMQRQKLLQSLEPEKAAEILKKVMS